MKPNQYLEFNFIGKLFIRKTDHLSELVKITPRNKWIYKYSMFHMSFTVQRKLSLTVRRKVRL